MKNGQAKTAGRAEGKRWAAWPALAALAAWMAGCVGMRPIPTPPIAVQPVALPAASAAGATPVPVPVASAPTATSVASVEVRTAPVADPRARTKAVLIVQNHTGAALPFTLATLGDWLQTALGTGPFSVVNPHDAIGTGQNVGAWGEKMPESSATRLAESLGAPVLLTASVTSARAREIGGTDPGMQAVLEFTLSAKAASSGEGVAAVTAAARSRPESSFLAFERKAANTWNEVAKEAAFSAARALAAEYEKAGGVPVAAAETVSVAFLSNVAGANVRIDGVSHGTIGNGPRVFAVSKGLHNLEVAYPGFEGFKDLVQIQGETTFEIRLALTAEGNAQRKKDALFDATMDRMEKSGATDDLVRELVARGYAKFLRTSHMQIEGVPQSATLVNSPGSALGLPDAQMDVPGGPSTEAVIDRARWLAE